MGGAESRAITQGTGTRPLVNSLTTLDANRITEALVNTRNPLKRAYSANDLRRAEWLEERAPDSRLDRGTSRIVILVLSLTLWAAIWVAVVSVSS